MAGSSVLEAVLRRDRLVTSIALALASLAAWAYVASGIGTAMPGTAMDPAMTAMPGMAMAPAKVATAVATGTNGQTLVVTPTRPLTRGSYRVDWRVVSVDTHAVKGSITFEVK